jgi:Icc-related predicted phosphoesterase
VRIVCISDTHNQLHRIDVPDGDVLVHAGDATMMGKVIELVKFNQALKDLPHKVKLFVPGNHDVLLERDRCFANNFITEAVVLEDKEYVVDGVKFYGSPWQPEFGVNWAFNKKRGVDLAERWALIPDDVNVLITHSPAELILDVTPEKTHVGCQDLARRIWELWELKVHVFGHIHTGYGTLNNPLGRFSEPHPRYLAVNASNCDKDYNPVNPPIVIDI